MSAFAGVLAFAGFSALTAAPVQDFDTCVGAVEGSGGTVESVRQVVPQRDLHAFDEAALTHSVAPEQVEELIVRLDSGPLVIFTRTEPHRLHAGQRVRVLLERSIARVEQCPTPLGALGRSTRPTQTWQSERT